MSAPAPVVFPVRPGTGRADLDRVAAALRTAAAGAWPGTDFLVDEHGLLAAALARGTPATEAREVERLLEHMAHRELGARDLRTVLGWQNGPTVAQVRHAVTDPVVLRWDRPPLGELVPGVTYPSGYPTRYLTRDARVVGALCATGPGRAALAEAGWTVPATTPEPEPEAVEVWLAGCDLSALPGHPAQALVRAYQAVLGPTGQQYGPGREDVLTAALRGCADGSLVAARAVLAGPGRG